MSSIILPILFVIFSFRIITYKYTLKIAGRIICINKAKSEIINYRFYLYFMIFIYTIVVIILMILKVEILRILWITLIILGFVSIIITAKLYKNINGIYVNGIIFNKFISWNNIHSFKWIDDITIEFWTKSGKAILFKQDIDKKIINVILNENKVMEKIN